MIALDEEEQSRWDNETVSTSRSKIEDKGKDEPAEPGSKESWQKLAGRTIGHFRITFSLFLKASLGAHLSYENEISLTCKLNSFSYERMSTKTRFEEEAKGNSEMAPQAIACKKIS